MGRYILQICFIADYWIGGDLKSLIFIGILFLGMVGMEGKDGKL